eukprot:GFYU01013947.1.p1 GENE.GFYU01013947.1~~GFYU01013947.1.p1  ORF type:complete len:560 (+),score=156.75 GFYU01013947.1:55-1734(+)
MSRPNTYEAKSKYMLTKVNPVFEELLAALIQENPDDPVPYMKSWLTQNNDFATAVCKGQKPLAEPTLVGVAPVQGSSKPSKGQKPKDGASSGKPSKAQVLTIFQQFDSDRSGSIDSAEFAQLAYAAGEPLTDFQIQEALKTLDANGDGEVTFAEFYDWLVADGNKGQGEKAWKMGLLQTKLMGMGLQRQIKRVKDKAKKKQAAGKLPEFKGNMMTHTLEVSLDGAKTERQGVKLTSKPPQDPRGDLAEYGCAEEIFFAVVLDLNCKEGVTKEDVENWSSIMQSVYQNHDEKLNKLRDKLGYEGWDMYGKKIEGGKVIARWVMKFRVDPFGMAKKMVKANFTDIIREIDLDISWNADAFAALQNAEITVLELLTAFTDGLSVKGTVELDRSGIDIVKAILPRPRKMRGAKGTAGVKFLNWFRGSSIAFRFGSVHEVLNELKQKKAKFEKKPFLGQDPRHPTWKLHLARMMKDLPETYRTLYNGFTQFTGFRRLQLIGSEVDLQLQFENNTLLAQLPNADSLLNIDSADQDDYAKAPEGANPVDEEENWSEEAWNSDEDWD